MSIIQLVYSLIYFYPFVLFCFSFWHSVKSPRDWGLAICSGDLYPVSQRIGGKAAVALVIGDDARNTRKEHDRLPQSKLVAIARYKLQLGNFSQLNDQPKSGLKKNLNWRAGQLWVGDILLSVLTDRLVLDTERFWRQGRNSRENLRTKLRSVES